MPRQGLPKKFKLVIIMIIMMATSLARAADLCSQVLASAPKTEALAQLRVADKELAEFVSAKKEVLAKRGYSPETIDVLYSFLKGLADQNMAKWDLIRQTVYRNWVFQYEQNRQNGFDYIDGLHWILDGILLTDQFESNPIEGPLFNGRIRFIERAKELFETRKIVILPVINKEKDKDSLLFADEELALLMNAGVMPLELVISLKNADKKVRTPSLFAYHDIEHFISAYQVFQAMGFLRKDRGIEIFISDLASMSPEFRTKLLRALFFYQHESPESFVLLLHSQFSEQIFETVGSDLNRLGISLTEQELSSLRLFMKKYFK